MCGRYAIKTLPGYENWYPMRPRQMQLRLSPEFRSFESYNVAPTQLAPVILVRDDVWTGVEY